MKTFFCRLVAPRPSFAQDMSPEEAGIMGEHGIYWRSLVAKGHAVAFGLVADPAGAFGIGILEVEDERVARRLTDADPTIRSGRGFRFEIHPMPMGITHRGTVPA